MIFARPTHREDFGRIELQAAQADVSRYWSKYPPTQYLRDGTTFTGVTADGQVMAIAGLIPIWEGRALVWALLSRHSGPHFRSLHRRVSAFLDAQSVRRMEATVYEGFTQGHRWLRMLGFECEGLMRAYTPDGASQYLYSRVRHG